MKKEVENPLLKVGKTYYCYVALTGETKPNTLYKIVVESKRKIIVHQIWLLYVRPAHVWMISSLEYATGLYHFCKPLTQAEYVALLI